MNTMTRFLTLTGMGVFAALAIGAGPAQAAGSTATPAAQPAAKPAAQQREDWDRTVGYYRSARACELAGNIGERLGRWDDHDCNFVGFGFRRGEWALEISNDRDWHGHGHGFPGHNFPGHNFPGGHGHGGHDGGHDGGGHDGGHDGGHHNHNR